MEGYAGAALTDQLAQFINGGLGLEHCETRCNLPLDAIRRPRNTPIWKLEAALKCRSCRTPHYSPPVHMIKLTECASLRLTFGFTQMRTDRAPPKESNLLSSHNLRTRQTSYNANCGRRAVSRPGR
jgi:hypothetical protein